MPWVPHWGRVWKSVLNNRQHRMAFQPCTHLGSSLEWIPSLNTRLVSAQALSVTVPQR